TVGEQRANTSVSTRRSRTKFTHSRTPQELMRVMPSSTRVTSPLSCRPSSAKSAFSLISPRSCTRMRSPPAASSCQLRTSVSPDSPVMLRRGGPVLRTQVREPRLQVGRHQDVLIFEAHHLGLDHHRAPAARAHAARQVLVLGGTGGAPAVEG